MHCILHTALYWLVDSLSTFILYYATCCITYYYNRIFQAVLAQYTVCHGYLSHVLLMHCILNCILNSIQLCGTLPIILHTAIHNTLPAAFNTMHYILNSVQLCGALPIVLHTAIHNALPAAFNTMHYILNSIQLCGALPIVLYTAIHNALPTAFNTMHYILNSVQLCGALPIVLLHTAIHNALPAAFNTILCSLLHAVQHCIYHDMQYLLFHLYLADCCIVTMLLAAFSC